MKAVTVFVVAGGMVRASSVMTGCDLVVVLLEAVLTFNLHRQVGEMYESTCRVNEYTAVPH